MVDHAKTPDTVRVRMTRNKMLGYDTQGKKLRALIGDELELPRSRAVKWRAQKACVFIDEAERMPAKKPEKGEPAKKPGTTLKDSEPKLEAET